MRLGRTAWAVAAVGIWCAATSWSWRLHAQRGGMFLGSADDPAIAYATAPLDNAVERLNRALQDGSATLTFEGRSGYLRSAIDALRLPVDSQLLVFSRASLQGRLVSPSSPRALFFDDRVVLAWVRDGELLEAAAHDPRHGVVFYSLEQRPAQRPSFKRELRCLGCHLTGDTFGVPGLLMFSTTPESADRATTIMTTDQRSPLAERWGGWFVTGNSGAARHRGNQVPALERHPGGGVESVAGLFEPDGYQGTSSDIAALLTFSHQTQMINLLTRAAWEARAADPALHPGRVAAPGQMQAVEALMSGVAEEVVDYMLFVGEAPLPNPVAGRSGFAERMSARGPRDRQGRSLYELDLKRRLMAYPCSYLIYSPAFDALPALAKEPIYRRMWQVLSGEAGDPRYRSLSLADRRAVVEILRDTKPDLPAYFAAVAR
ncbi:MAG TPA: hypothetical protein VNN99_03175 [Vicinamibacterales bacterium]|nr:hypothetical protein [Vicinamibacterales bacterium]